jgi:DNA-binding transcriptional LysR family regulator
MFIDRELGTFGIHDRRVIVEFGHPEAMKQMVASGVGVCWLFESAVTDELLNRTLKEVTVEGVEIVGPIYFVRRTDKFLSAVHRDLVEALKCHMGK